MELPGQPAFVIQRLSVPVNKSTVPREEVNVLLIEQTRMQLD